MYKINFENETYQSVKREDGSTVITVLKDNRKFFGVDATGCRFITTKEGFCNDEPSHTVKQFIKERSEGNQASKINIWDQIRNRHLNNLMSMLWGKKFNIG